MSALPRLRRALHGIFDARVALLALLATAALHVVLRVGISPPSNPALKWDEAEQVLWSQHLAWGYGAQPPLSTWLQWVVSALLGPGVLALSLFKHTLLAACFVLLHAAARCVAAPPRNAWLAAAALMFMPPLTWYSVRDQTHTVLVTVLVIAAWLLLLRSLRRPHPWLFAAQGVVWGLALLAKYNAALALAAMLAAALSLPTLRRALLARGWPLAPLIAALMLAPHLIWMAQHWTLASGTTLDRMAIGRHSTLRAVLDLGAGALAVLGLWALVVLFSFGRALWQRQLAKANDDDEEGAPPAWLLPLVLRALLLTALALLAMTLAGVSAFKGRWLLPLLAPAPLALLAARPALAQHARGCRRYAACTLAMAAALLILGGGRAHMSGVRGKLDSLNQPVAQLGTALSAAGYDGSAPIAATDPVLAAALRLHFGAPAAACWPRESQGSAFLARCAAAQLARARAAGQGLLLISRQQRLRPDWWPAMQAGTALPLWQQPHSVQLPARRTRAAAPPVHFQFFWLPPQRRSAPTP